MEEQMMMKQTEAIPLAVGKGVIGENLFSLINVK